MKLIAIFKSIIKALTPATFLCVFGKALDSNHFSLMISSCNLLERKLKRRQRINSCA